MDSKYSESGKYDNNDCSTSDRSFDWQISELFTSQSRLLATLKE